MQFPLLPLVGAAFASHGFGLHCVLVKVPALHEVAPDGVYPCLHVGLHVFPEASAAVQSPLAPLSGGARASHGLGVHCAAASLPAWQKVLPFTVYPWLQTGLHVEPEAKVAVQLPLAPLVGGWLASHGFGKHCAAVSLPPALTQGCLPTFEWHLDIALSHWQQPTLAHCMSL